MSNEKQNKFESLLELLINEGLIKNVVDLMCDSELLECFERVPVYH